MAALNSQQMDLSIQLIQALGGGYGAGASASPLAPSEASTATSPAIGQPAR
jgi:hypothetical protein